MKVIGMIGNIGSGKDAAADYICEKYSYRNVSMGDIVREILKREGKPETRENLDRLQKEYTEKYGTDFFAQQVLEMILFNKWRKVIISGIRRPADAEVPKEAFGEDFVLIEIEAPAEVRFERIGPGARNRPGDPKTLEEFNKQEEGQMKFFGLGKTLDMVDHKIDNSGSKKDLQKNIDELLEKIGFD